MTPITETNKDKFLIFEKRTVIYAALAAVTTAVALTVLACCLASGCFTPGMEYHIASYLACGALLVSLVPFMIGVALLGKENHMPLQNYKQ